MENNSIEIKFKTLTPLWTGDIDQKCTKIKETGIIGSLRWWYEALLRGLGGYACDPTDSDCKFDYDAYKKTGDIEEGLKDVCDVCRLFGCSGWKRRFRLEVENREPIYPGMLIAKVKGNRGWYLKGGIHGNLKTKIIESAELVSSLMKLISQSAGVGARTQQGYGSFHLECSGQLNVCSKKLIDYIKNRKNESISFEQRHLPDLKHFFFCKIQLESSYIEDFISGINFIYKGQYPDRVNGEDELLKYLKENYGFVPLAPLIRYKLRRLNVFQDSNDLRHFLMGIMGTGSNPTKLKMGAKSYSTIGSKIHVSHAYKTSNGDWEIKIWGWIPKYLLIKKKRTEMISSFNEFFIKDREEVLEELKNEISKEFSISDWREFNSHRDTEGKTPIAEDFILDLGDLE